MFDVNATTLKWQFENPLAIYTPHELRLMLRFYRSGRFAIGSAAPQKTGPFAPATLTDRYQAALMDLIQTKDLSR
jgi:hypothetical protein